MVNIPGMLIGAGTRRNDGTLLQYAGFVPGAAMRRAIEILLGVIAAVGFCSVARAQLLIAHAEDRAAKVGSELVNYYTSHNCLDDHGRELLDDANTVISMVDYLRSVGKKEKSLSYEDDRSLYNASYGLQLRRNEMEALPRCEPQTGGSPKFGPRPSTALGLTTPQTLVAATASPYTIEAVGYAGGIGATSFGNNYNAGLIGARAAVSIPFEKFRFQVDFQGEGTGHYSRMVGSRSYFSAAGHFDYMVLPGTEIGVFGGGQNASPTFFLPTNMNYFIGIEGRQFFGPAMIGAQFGRFDTLETPGTFTKAWFAEGRGTFSIGRAAGISALDYTLVSGNVGYASGTATLTTTDAHTTYWGLGISQRFESSAFSLFANYQHFENRVSGLGTVWNEDMVVGGVKVLFPSTPTERLWLEPTRPQPYVLRTITNF